MFRTIALENGVVERVGKLQIGLNGEVLYRIKEYLQPWFWLRGRRDADDFRSEFF